jgi:hypothetical protein
MPSYRKKPDRLDGVATRRLLDALGTCRQAVISAQTQVKVARPVYHGCQMVTAAIDGLAKLVTGSNSYFHADPSAAELLLIQNASMKVVRLNLMAEELLAGSPVDADHNSILAWSNSLRLDLRELGLEKRLKNISPGVLPSISVSLRCVNDSADHHHANGSVVAGVFPRRRPDGRLFLVRVAHGAARIARRGASADVCIAGACSRHGAERRREPRQRSRFSEIGRRRIVGAPPSRSVARSLA